MLAGRKPQKMIEEKIIVEDDPLIIKEELKEVDLSLTELLENETTQIFRKTTQ